MHATTPHETRPVPVLELFPDEGTGTSLPVRASSTERLEGGLL